MSDLYTKSVDELIEQSPNKDNQSLFKDLWAILTHHKKKIDQCFPGLQLDPSYKDLKNFSSTNNEAIGSISAYASHDVDWQVHSYIGTPQKGFSNMHLATWLGPQVKVPHLGMALGTIPDLFVYLDYIPRVDLMHDLDYLDQYYNEQNQTYLEFENNSNFTPFVSRTPYMRQTQSSASICYMAKPTLDSINKIEKASDSMLTRWLSWVNQAKTIGTEQQLPLSERDLYLRKNIAERDPANIMAEKIFGPELTTRLVGALWGKSRSASRAGSWQQ